MEDQSEPYECLTGILRFVNTLNAYVDHTAPWRLAKEGKREELAAVMYDLLFSLQQLSGALAPFLPATAVKIKRAIGGNDLTSLADCRRSLGAGQKVEDIKMLFPRIEK